MIQDTNQASETKSSGGRVTETPTSLQVRSARRAAQGPSALGKLSSLALALLSPHPMGESGDIQRCT